MQSDSFISPRLELRKLLRSWRSNSAFFFVATTLVLALLAGASGCRVVRPCFHQPVSVPSSVEKTSLSSVPIGEARAIDLPFVEKSERGKIPDGFVQVFPLSVEECERLAASHSPLSAVLDVESNPSGPCQPCSQVDPCVRDAINSIVSANATYQRNQSAEQALMAYLGLAQVYLQNQVLDETIDELNDLQNVLKQLQGEGLLRDVDPESLARKKLETMEQRNELLFNFEKLNDNLRALLGLERPVHPIWTDCQIAPWQIPNDLQQELEIAMTNRTDLQSLQRLTSITNEQILETLRNSVRSTSPLAGLVLERRIFGGFFADNSAEIAKLRSQLMILHAAQIDLARSQVSENFYSVIKNHELIQLKKQKLESLRKSEARLEAKRQVGPIEVDEVLTVKSGILKCRAEIIRSAVELQMSWIRLRSAQGLLGRNDLSAESIAGRQSERLDSGSSAPSDQKIEQISIGAQTRTSQRQQLKSFLDIR